MKIEVDGKTWTRKLVRKISFEGSACWGITDHDKRRIRIVPDKLNRRRALDTDIHEFTHSFFPFLNELSATQFSKDLTDYLWKLGYRKE